MALSEKDRMEISKKIVSIPDEEKNIEITKQQIQKKKKEAEEKDATNSQLQKIYDEKINAYQKELNLLDGKKRSEITESIINSAAQQEVDNGFFLADPEKPIPSVPKGVWKFFSPMAFTYAVGKNKDESYGSEPLGEFAILNSLKKLVEQVETFADATRATGKKCEETFTCVGGVGETMEECTAGDPPGTWTAQQTVVDSLEIQGLLSNLKSEIQKWKNSLSKQKISIQINDKNVPERLAENETAYDDVLNALSIINKWQEIQDFDTQKELPDNPLDLNNCEKFNDLKYKSYCSLNQYTNRQDCEANNGRWFEVFQESKLSIMEITKLKNELNSRISFVKKRQTQLRGHLGNISQDKNTGKIKTQSGWYGKRYLILDTRLNLVSGSAVSKFGAETGLKAQDQLKETNKNTGAAYELSLKAAKAVAPGLDTPYINLKDASAFDVGDDIYVVANDQKELSGKVLEKDGNRLKLSFNVPKKYNIGNLTRLYKVLSGNI